jgi:peptidoglycan hydrolase CwlO-like protein
MTKNLNYNPYITYKIISQFIWRVLIVGIILILPLIGQASIIDELDKQIQEQEAKRAELERQAQEYQAIINQKRGEIKSLSNQIAIFNARINKLQIEINITEDDISQTKLEILQLEYGIDQTQGDINEQKDNLAKIIQTIAEFDQTSQLEIILQSEDFSDFFNQLTYLDNLQNGVQEKVNKLKALKEKLSQDKESKEDKKERLEGLKEQLNNQKWSLASQRNSKKALLKYTQGEESKYQQMLANIEAQKKSLLGDINRLRQQKAAELARLKELQEKPPTQYWASTNWYYQQHDSRWAKTTIGISDSKMEDYGCAVTAIAMILNYHGTKITPGQLAKESIFYYDLIVWPRKWGSVTCINCPPPHTSSFDWFRLDRELGAGYPVIVFVRANGRGAGHYVVIHHKTADGRYVVHDPLFGDNIYLESTQVYISNLYETTTSLDQMIIYH